MIIQIFLRINGRRCWWQIIGILLRCAITVTIRFCIWYQQPMGRQNFIVQRFACYNRKCLIFSFNIFHICYQEHACRSECLEIARELDNKSAEAWVGHPYFDVIDNSTNFESKMNRMIEAVCQKLAIDTGDRLQSSSRKLKFLGKNIKILIFIQSVLSIFALYNFSCQFAAR